MTFLYDTVVNSIVPIESNEDIEFICSICKQLPEEERENVWYLIINYFVDNHKNSEKAIEIINKHISSKRSKKFILGGQRLIGGKGFTFKISSLPSELQNVIYTYLIMITDQRDLLNNRK